MKNNEIMKKIRGGFKYMRAVDGNLRCQFPWPKSIHLACGNIRNKFIDLMLNYKNIFFTNVSLHLEGNKPKANRCTERERGTE